MRRRWNRGARGARKEKTCFSLRSLRTLRFLLIVTSLWPSAAAAQPTFSKDVGPIIKQRCSSCHQPGEIGPFSLITYDDVKRHAAQIADVTRRRIMPPWKPAAGKGEFANERRLSDRELDTLQRWIADGAPEGDASALPSGVGERPRASADGERWQLGTPDLVVRMPQDYAVPADGTDLFRTFVIPIP